MLLEDLAKDYSLPEAIGPVHVLPVVETVRRYVAEVRDKSDVIVVLGHIHDTSEADAILREVPEVSAAIVGHNHEGYKEIHNTDGRVAVLVHSYGVEFGRLELDVNMKTHRATLTSWKKIA